MKKLSFVALAFVLALSVGCSCGIEKKAVNDLKATHDLIYPEYLKLVEKEYAADKDKIDNRKKLVQSSNDIVNAMKKAVE